MLKNYIKMALKVFMRRKFFTFISLFAISFTLMILMVAATFLDHMFGPFPPEVRTDRMLGVYRAQMIGKNGSNSSSPGYAFLDRYVRTLPDVEKVSVFTSPYNQTVSAYLNDGKIELQRKRTDAAFWEILAFDFVEGGPYTAQDVDDASMVAVINEATRARFFGNESAVGKTIEVDGQRFRIIGVVKNVPSFRETSYADLWVPITTEKSDAYRSNIMGFHQALILAKDASDFARIKATLRDRLPRVEIDNPGFDTYLTAAETKFDAYGRDFIGSLETGRFGGDYAKNYGDKYFMGIVLLMILFMMLPTINLININVSRIMERASEIGVRKAFGASSWTLVGQFVTENVILTLIGGLIGGALTAVTLDLIGASGLIPHAQFHMNYRIFLYGLMIILFFGVFSGVYPAYRMSRLHPVEALRGGER